MTVFLEIVDGNPQWYLSPNIWTVPGDDPEGSPGLPVAGQSCFVWANVRNNGSNVVQNATVRFYWANPSVGFDRNSANLIGSSFVTLNPGQRADVLCLTPWVPVFVNNGHECVLAEAFHSTDPLPGSSLFNVPVDRHVAQRNLSVIETSAAQKMMFHLPFEIHNTSRKPRIFQITATQGRFDELNAVQTKWGKKVVLPKEEGKFEKLGFVHNMCPDAAEIDNAKPVIERLEVPGHSRLSFTLTGRLSGPGALVNVSQTVDNQVVGGLSALILAHDVDKKAIPDRKKGA